VQEGVIMTWTDAEEHAEHFAEMILGDSDYKSKDTDFIATLNGATPLLGLVMGAISRRNNDYHPYVTYADITTYGSGTLSGEPEIRLLPRLRPGRRAVFIDEIEESGKTMGYLINAIEEAASDNNVAPPADHSAFFRGTKNRPEARMNFRGQAYAGRIITRRWVRGLGANEGEGDRIEEYRWQRWMEVSPHQPAKDPYDDLLAA
jgi:hypoxanthine-guanine phosphoribosyltransferase